MNEFVQRLETATKLSAAAKEGLVRIPTMDAQALLMMLEEQEVKDMVSDAIHETAKQFRQTIVRCKDCKDACICSDDWVICTHIDSNGNDKHPVDWFCADGERSDLKGGD